LRGLTGSSKSVEDMPLLYEKIRLEMARGGFEHENYMEILKTKINVLGGMNFISPENINKANSNRTENFNKFIESCYPYIKLAKPEAKKMKTNEELIEEYKKMFPDMK
jgi:hypothetical protein